MLTTKKGTFVTSQLHISILFSDFEVVNADHLYALELHVKGSFSLRMVSLRVELLKLS